MVRNDTNQEDPWLLQAGCQSVSEGQHLLDHTRSSDQATVLATLSVVELQKSPTSACSCHRQIQSEEKKIVLVKIQEPSHVRMALDQSVLLKIKFLISHSKHTSGSALFALFAYLFHKKDARLI